MLIRNATLRDCEELASSLRAADLRELLTLHPGACPKAILAQSLGMSDHAFVAVHNDQVVCMGGVAPRGDGSGSVWLLGSDLMDSHRIALGRVSPQCIKLVQRYRIIHNHVDSRNALHIRWLRWLGFQQLNTISINDVPFINFYRIDQCVTR